MPKHSAILLVLCAAASCHAQSAPASSRLDIAPAPSARFPVGWYPPDKDGDYVAPDLGAPYSATMITAGHTINPATGTETTVDEVTLRFRDSAGRTRDDDQRAEPDGHGGATRIHHIHVNDPVSHCSFYWQDPSAVPDKPVATVSCHPRTLHYSPGPDMSALLVAEARETELQPGTIDHAEPLAKRNFDDVEAIGVRHTETKRDAETGKTVTNISELWYSPEINQIVEMKMGSSIQAGNPSDMKITTQLTNIRRGEPDPSLFYPPSQYAIKPEQ